MAGMVRIVSAILFLAVCATVLLPWVGISIFGTGLLEISQLQLITGIVYKTKMFGREYSQKITDPMVLAALPLLIAFIGAVLSAPKGKKARIARGIVGIIGFLSVLLIGLIMNITVSREGYGLVGVNFRIGFWLALLFFLGSAGLNLLARRWLGQKK